MAEDALYTLSNRWFETVKLPNGQQSYEFARQMKLGLLKGCCRSPLLHLLVDLLSDNRHKNVINWCGGNSSVFDIIDREGVVQMWSEQSRQQRSYISVVCQLKAVCNKRVPSISGKPIRILSRVSTGSYHVFPDYAAHEIPLISPKFLEWQLQKMAKTKKTSQAAVSALKEKSKGWPVFHFAGISPTQNNSTAASLELGIRYKKGHPQLSFVIELKSEIFQNPSHDNTFYCSSSPTTAAPTGITFNELSELPELSVDDVDAVLFEAEHPCDPYGKL
ncbi:unnamed protein product [Haemonchus placei]|uniref:ETS domain-containing protein n=1 Tax=Haemonchus placei TaxID=6290 RepID=A0A0N4WFD2_HAEPC|nr:unnamed protein product [Haemonchus placei]